MTIDLPGWKRKRTTVKSKITRIESFVKSFKDGDDLCQLESRIPHLENAFKEFEQYQDEIEQFEFEEDDNTREEVEIQYHNTVAKIKNLTSKVKSPSASNSHNNSGGNNQSSPELAVKLPALNLPQFSGSYTEWLPFYDTFNSLINNNANLNNCQKFHYLKSCLKGEASATIESLTISTDNYNAAYELLIKRYNNIRLIAQEHVLAIINSPVISKANHVSLRKLLNDITTNIEALRVQKQAVDHWDCLIVPLICEKLDYTSRKEWQTKLNTDIPKLKDLLEFLGKRCELLECMSKNDKSSQHNEKQKTNYNKQTNQSKHQIVQTVINKSCIHCKSESHMVFKCPEFLNLSTSDRIKTINNLKACRNCFKLNHTASACKSVNTCRECQQKHNTLLHLSESTSANDNLTLSISNKTTVLLATAIVKIADSAGNYHNCRAVLDCGSQSNILTSNMCKKLSLKTNHINLPISGVGEIETRVKYSANVSIKSCYNSFALKMHCLILPKITEQFPNQTYSRANLNIPDNIELADPHFNECDKIDLLIGAEFFWRIIGFSQAIDILNKQIYLRRTLLGWVVTGKIINGQNNSGKHFVGFTSNKNPDVELSNQLTKFWQLEEQTDNQPPLSADEFACEKHFAETVRRGSDGRFVVRLPFKGDVLLMGPSNKMALKRFYSVEKRLHQNPTLKRDYTTFMNEYLHLEHMMLVSPYVPEDNSHANQYFLPHHAVIKESSSTTRVRVVFDGSAKTTTGISLNDMLMVGPTVQQDLFSIITRFRTHQVAFSCDIVKMYRQIWVDPRDTAFQRILWRDDVRKSVNIYELKTVTYGTASAPYLATKCLQQLAIDEQHNFPLASPVILKDFYVDDLLTGTNTISNSIELRNQLISALSKGGFQLQKWASNYSEILPAHETGANSTVKLDHKHEVKTLGLVWNCKNDTLKYTVNANFKECPTKRSVLSTIAQIYDILGLLSPVIVKAKILIQEMWALKLDWDDPLPIHIREKWMKLSDQLHMLNTLQIPRKIISNAQNQVELHGFCDSSMAAYGACIYIRTCDETNNTYNTELLCSRSRVAPLKIITLPRLELCAAVLLARMVNKILSTLNLEFKSVFLWTDSSIVLSWLNSSPNTWKIFVANRVAEIQRLTEVDNWHHIGSKNNPADLVSRGVLPENLIDNHFWFHGPSFLSNHKTEWPNSLPDETKTNDSEKRTNNKVLAVSVKLELPFLTKYSSFAKTQRILAYCLRFIQNCSSKNDLKQTDKTLTVAELNNAANMIIKLVQKQEFESELKELTKNQPVKRSSKLLNLNPFLDNNGIIRVGGRLINAHINYDQKFPIVLPSKHHITKLIILDQHEKELHAGPSATITAIREKYWPLSARSVVRNLIYKCHTCFKVNPQTTDQLMGNLPSIRVTPSMPFSHCGVDYAGPILIKEGNRRSKKTIKSYIALFKCFATKAVHIEIVTDATCEAFLAALKRFMARRGKVSSIHSDNATYFTAANRELTKLFTSANFQNEIIQSLKQQNIQWHFIPARSPHRGGFWEAGIKAIKFHLKRVVGNALFTYEEMLTVLVQIEACINSRPITPLSSDPNDFSPLTPGHFLIGRRLTSNSEPDLTLIKENLLSRWQRVQQVTQHFWKRWSKEHLNTLQQRNKWRQRSQEVLQAGTPILLKEENLHPLCWRMGVILEVHPGPDGLIRTATIKTSTGIVTRATNRICPFPTEDFEQDRSKGGRNVQDRPVPLV
jgi:hypothetical protein